MPRPHLEVADVIRAHGRDYLDGRPGAVSPAKKRVLRDLADCRTAALGGHLDRCDQCGHEEGISYNSCRNRHCPKCQAAAQADWLDARQAELLPVEYFHVVFTVPSEITAIAGQNKKTVYNILFRASAETLQQIAGDPKHLGAEIGFLSILHTWGQNLIDHPHIHCVVPGGGLSPDGTRWLSCPKGFFLPVRVLSRLFRGKVLDQIKQAFQRGELSFQGQLSHLNNPAAFSSHIAPTYEKEWVVYAKAPFAGPEQVLKYLACYTHRVAIANSRLISMKDGKVTFWWKDYAHGNRRRKMTLDATEFLRRFLLHILPRGFVRIRYYGFLANRAKANKLELCRRLLGQPPSSSDASPDSFEFDAPENEPARPRQCPVCETGTMLRLRVPREPGLSFGQVRVRGPTDSS